MPKLITLENLARFKKNLDETIASNEGSVDTAYVDEKVAELNTALSNKVDKASGKGLSTNDFTTEEKEKLESLSNYDDTAVKSLITAEETARKNADTTLQNNIDAKYTKPLNGIPKTDLASDIKTSLSKADTALQSIPSEYVTETELNDKDYATNSALANKVDKVSGKGLSTNDYTTAEKTKLAGLENYDDTELSNKVSQNESDIDDLSNDKVDKSTTVNGKALTSNITLSASDVSALPNTTKYATDLSIVMNSSSYTINIQLKDQDGNSIGATRGIDLPLESVVVSGNYDDATKEVVLVLKNGSEVRFSVADLVDGLANQTDLDTTNTNVSNLTTRVTNTETKNTEQDTAISNKVDKTTTVNGKALSSNINITKTDVGLGYVDNTSDLNKPISTATQTALNSKANQSSLDTTNEELNATKTRLQQVVTAHDGLLEQHLDLVDVVDTKVSKIENTTGTHTLYGEDYSKSTRLYKTSIVGGKDTIPYRDETGNFYVETPTADKYVANKKYVDDATSGKADKTTTVNGKPLSSNITITAGELNAYTKTEIDNLLDDKAEANDLTNLSNKVNGIDTTVNTNKTDISNLKTSVNTNTFDIGNLKTSVNGKVDKTTTINGVDLSSNIILDADDVGALSNKAKLISSVYVDYQDKLQFYKSNVDGVEKFTTIEPATSELGGIMSRTDKKKLDTIEENAQVNVQADWNETDSSADAYIKNKPVIPEGSVLYDSLGDKTDGSITQKVVTDSFKAYKDFLAVSNTNQTMADITATINGIYDFKLYEGLEIFVKFTYGANFSDGQSRTLNINNTGAKSILAIAPQNWTYKFKTNVSAGNIVRFVYNGSNWLIRELVTQGIDVGASFKWLNAVKLAQSSGTDRAFYGEEDINLSDSYVDKFANQTIAGVKNFTSTPTVNGVNVATTNDVPNTNNFATKQEGVYLVDGTGNTTAGTWAGTNNRITSYYDGLTVNFKIGIAGGDSTNGTTLNINGLGAKLCYMRGTSKITTHYAVGTMVLLTYNATTDAFYSSDYDANSNVTQTVRTTNGDFPLLLRGTSAGTTTTTTSTTFGTKFLANPSTGELKATKFTENGTTLASKYLGISAKAASATTADTATKATQDGSGNVITSTYAKKTEIPAAITVDTALSSTSTNPVQNKVVNSALSGKQATLVSGTNIKTINNQSILGSGNISVTANITVDSALSTTSTNPVQNKVVTNKLATKVNFTETTETTETVNRLLDLIYPVGSIRLSINANETNFLGGTWELVSQGRAIFGAGTVGNKTLSAGGTLEAGLPNITGSLDRMINYGDWAGHGPNPTGSFESSSTSGQGGLGNGNGYSAKNNLNFDASRSSSIYGNNTTVCPPAYGLYVYKRKS